MKEFKFKAVTDWNLLDIIIISCITTFLLFITIFIFFTFTYVAIPLFIIFCFYYVFKYLRIKDETD